MSHWLIDNISTPSTGLDCIKILDRSFKHKWLKCQKPHKILITAESKQPQLNNVSSAEIDHCADGKHGCEQEFVNTEDSCVCKCRKGYTLQPDRKTCQSESIYCDDDNLVNSRGRKCNTENSLLVCMRKQDIIFHLCVFLNVCVTVFVPFSSYIIWPVMRSVLIPELSKKNKNFPLTWIMQFYPHIASQVFKY